MLPDLSPTHILIVVVVALVVVGPKDLPMLLRKIGQFMAKMRGMANEFRASFDEMARQSELDELRKEVAAMRATAEQAVPRDLGIAYAINSAGSSDAEGAYMAQWQASQAAAEPFLPGLPETNTILPPAAPEPAPPHEPALHIEASGEPKPAGEAAP